ncbi:hypothetical protein [Companilactobacillus ginsenosidimutans]|uniref:hypothetical protein n=1 Tax=Companilactobacillus ginsenosidimutans TaxID=1007676 RepID=UPI00069EB252|nr:hypothetical protein [Companilactobacillus ginsenosidimutans]
MEYISAGAVVHGMELATEDQGVGANYNMACLSSIPDSVLPDGFSPLFALTLGTTIECFSPVAGSLDKIKTDILK